MCHNETVALTTQSMAFDIWPNGTVVPKLSEKGIVSQYTSTCKD